MFFISSAFAQEAAAQLPAEQAAASQLVMIGLLIVVFYLFLWRPQQKRMRDHREMISALRRGDKVVTSGGIVGTIARIDDEDTVLVEIAAGVQVKVIRSTITQIMGKGTTKTETKEEAPAAVAKPANDTKKPSKKTQKNG